MKQLKIWSMMMLMVMIIPTKAYSQEVDIDERDLVGSWNRVEAIDVCYPQDKDVQRRLIQDISSAKQQQQAAINNLNRAMSTLSNVIDGREDDFFDEEIDEIE